MKSPSTAVSLTLAASIALDSVTAFTETATSGLSFSRGLKNVLRSNQNVCRPGCSYPLCSSTSLFAGHRIGCTCPLCTGAASPSTLFNHRPGCTCPLCVSATVRNHPPGCTCPLCTGRRLIGRTTLRMSEEEAPGEPPEETPEDEVPPEVAKLDGVESEEEAHNTERPARGSGLQKHKRAPESEGKPLSEFEEGQEVEATVKTITTYGAFLDIGATTDALVHVSRLSDDFVSNVEDVVKKGEVVKVRILNVNLEKNQVSVTMRSREVEESASQGEEGSGGRRKQRPQRSGGDRAAQQKAIETLAEKGFDDDKFVEGEVVSMLDFGAFVRFGTSQLVEGVEGELDGLVHISALRAERTANVSDVVSVGDKVQVRVKNLDVENGRVSLSMITKDEEPKPREKQGRRGRSMFSPDEMGAKDWKKSLAEFDAEQPEFTNTPIVQTK